MRTWIPLVSPFLTIVALVATWIGWRRRELRRDDVLHWGSEAIEALQTLYLICLKDAASSPAPNDAVDGLGLKMSVLTERGRLFFRNVPHPTHGSAKMSAYRGYRPCILDPLVTAYRITREWPQAEGEVRARMVLVAEDSIKTFVSLLQKEVGRDRTASADTSIGGRGEDLRHLLDRVDPDRLRAVMAAPVGKAA